MSGKAHMSARCPACVKAGETEPSCLKCGGTGFVRVTIADGTIYTRHCNACGFENGGRVVGDGLPPLPPRPDDCVQCGSADVVWREVGKT